MTFVVVQQQQQQQQPQQQPLQQPQLKQTGLLLAYTLGEDLFRFNTAPLLNQVCMDDSPTHTTSVQPSSSMRHL
jgi:hypothetical protein